MTILQVLQYPDERLRKIATSVTTINQEIQDIIKNMFETMYAKKGLGLAATQVNIHKRIIVIDISENQNKKLVLINPEFLEKTGGTGIEEGCLSIPKHHAFIQRAEKIKIYALDQNGKTYQLKTNGLLAICIQHEIDHLNGKLFIDYISPLKRQRIKNKLKKQIRKKLQLLNFKNKLE